MNRRLEEREVFRREEEMARRRAEFEKAEQRRAAAELAQQQEVQSTAARRPVRRSYSTTKVLHEDSVYNACHRNSVSPGLKKSDGNRSFEISKLPSMLNSSPPPTNLFTNVNQLHREQAERALEKKIEERMLAEDREDHVRRMARMKEYQAQKLLERLENEAQVFSHSRLQSHVPTTRDDVVQRIAEMKQQFKQIQDEVFIPLCCVCLEE